MKNINKNLVIVIPTLNEAQTLTKNLDYYRALCAEQFEIIVVDAGSSDKTKEIARQFAHQVLTATSCRGLQLNYGARSSNRPFLLFLHADCQIPIQACMEISHVLYTGKAQWGSCRVQLANARSIFRIIEFCMNSRTYISNVITGDHALFMTRSIFEQVKGYPDFPIIEDIEICRRLKKISSPIRLPRRVIVSTRKWEAEGVYRTIWLMWKLRLLYFLGVKPAALVNYYYKTKYEHQ